MNVLVLRLSAGTRLVAVTVTMPNGAVGVQLCSAPFIHMLCTPLAADLPHPVRCPRTTQADGVLMGCSTFGQIAGILTNGIKFFSVGCMGHVTPVQYRMIPPFAIAEYGHMWVPIDGSWRDPVLSAEAIFHDALRELILTKGLLHSGLKEQPHENLAEGLLEHHDPRLLPKVSPISGTTPRG